MSIINLRNDYYKPEIKSNKIGYCTSNIIKIIRDDNNISHNGIIKRFCDIFVEKSNINFDSLVQNNSKVKNSIDYKPHIVMFNNNCNTFLRIRFPSSNKDWSNAILKTILQISNERYIYIYADSTLNYNSEYMLLKI